MNKFEQYDIAYQGLKDGIHNFQFKIDNKFFDQYDISELNGKDVSVAVVLTKETTMLTFEFSISGLLNVMCDRCLDYFDMPIDLKQILYVKFSDEIQDEADVIIFVPRTESHINIAHYIYEFINLGIPLKKVHPDDKKGKSTCNKEMLERIEKLSVHNNLADESRWDEIKKIINN